MLRYTRFKSNRTRTLEIRLGGVMLSKIKISKKATAINSLINVQDDRILLGRGYYKKEDACLTFEIWRDVCLRDL